MPPPWCVHPPKPPDPVLIPSYEQLQQFVHQYGFALQPQILAALTTTLQQMSTTAPAISCVVANPSLPSTTSLAQITTLATASGTTTTLAAHTASLPKNPLGEDRYLMTGSELQNLARALQSGAVSIPSFDRLRPPPSFKRLAGQTTAVLPNTATANAPPLVETQRNGNAAPCTIEKFKSSSTADI